MKKHIFPLFLLLSVVGILSFTLARPRLFVIGDSISVFYGPYLKKYLQDKFDYDRKRDKGEAMKNLDIPVGANGGDSRMVLNYLKKLSSISSFKADVLLLNCGLHDVKTDLKTGKRQVELEEYRSNLDQICRLTSKMKLQLVWINTTPVNDSIHNSKRIGFHRFNKDVVRYNQVADSLFSRYGIPIIDLYGFSSKFPMDAYMDHVHYTEFYRDLQAAYISGFLENCK